MDLGIVGMQKREGKIKDKIGNYLSLSLSRCVNACVESIAMDLHQSKNWNALTSIDVH